MDVRNSPQPQLPRVAHELTEEASDVGTEIKQYQIKGLNYEKMNITNSPTDFLEIPQPSLMCGFLKLAKEARNGCVGHEECLPVDDDLPQVTGTTNPVVVTTEKFSHTSSHLGAVIAPLVEHEQCHPVDVDLPPVTGTTKPVVVTTEKCSHTSSHLGAVIAPLVEHEQCHPVDVDLPPVTGTTKPVVVTIEKFSHTSSQLGALIAPLVSAEERMPRIPAGVIPPVATMGIVGPYDETVQSVISETESEDGETYYVGPVGPCVILDTDQPVADGPVGPSETESEDGETDSVGPVGPCVSLDTDRLVADGPVGPSVTLSPVGLAGRFSQCDSDQPVADGSVSPSVTLGPVGPDGMLSQCDIDRPVADGPVGPLGMFPQNETETDQPVTNDPLDPDATSIQHDIDKVIVITDEPASSVGTFPSSDSGIYSLGKRWQDSDMIPIKGRDVKYPGNDTLPLYSSCEDYNLSRLDPPDRRSVFLSSISTGDNRIDCPTRQCGSDLRIPTHDTVHEYDRIELTDESSSDGGADWCSVCRNSTVDTGIVQLPHMHPMVRNGASQQGEDSDLLTSECDGNDTDICNLSDVQSETEQRVDDWDAGYQHEIIDDVTVRAWSHRYSFRLPAETAADLGVMTPIRKRIQ